MTISLIVATDNFNAIGYQNKIPWNLPEDLKYFKERTYGKKVLMGRKTYDSIISYLGKPLPDRINLVVTRDENLKNDEHSFYKVENLSNFLSEFQYISNDEVMVIGGQQIYRQALPYADTVYLTEVNTIVSLADSYFPHLKSTEWILDSSNPVYKEDKTLSHTFNIYKRIKASNDLLLNKNL